jgi:hypothetical protein
MLQTSALFVAIQAALAHGEEYVHATTISPAGTLANGGDDLSSADDDGLDLLAFNAIRDDALPVARAAFTEMLARDGEDAFASMWLGMVAVQQANLKLAEKAFAIAVANVANRMWVEDDKEAFALAAKRAQLELSLRRVRERMAPFEAANSHEQTNDESGASERLLRKTPIRRVRHWEMGQAEFEAQHQVPRLPVIIEGFSSLASEGSPAWSAQHLLAKCGHLKPPLAQFSATSASWAGMFKAKATAPPENLAAYLEAITSQGSSWGEEGGGGMVFDWALRHKGEGEGCSALLEHLLIPSYFGGTIVSGFGPSLFVQANGTRCGLHFDKGGTHFWQYVWEGAKRWRIFAPADWPRLFRTEPWRRAFFRDPRCSGLFGKAAEEAAACDDGFGALPPDAFDDDELERLARESGDVPLQVFEGTLRPGELLFVPANSPHQVVNVGGAGVAMSMNFVDFSNAQLHFDTLLETAQTHPKFRSRLNHSGTVVPGSKTRWFERFRMPEEDEELRRLSAVAQHVQQQAPRSDAAFLEPWETFAKRPWNLKLKP